MTIYAAAGACAEAGRALRAGGDAAGELRMRLRCLPPVRRGARLDLARIGANARRASEDSTAVAYVGEADPAADRFAAPILAEARIAHLPTASGAAAVASVRRALEGSSGSLGPRQAVYDAVAG